MATETRSTFQRIAVPRIRNGVVAGVAIGAVAALFLDPTNMNSLALFGGGGIFGASVGFAAALMTSESVWEARQ
jgi:gas vesicle protein